MPLPPDPVGNFDFPDPAATYHDGTYYAFGGVQAMASKGDLSSFGARWDYLSASPAWAQHDTRGGAPGAPVQLASGGWMMTFQGEEANCHRAVCTCIGAAFATSLHVGVTIAPAPKPLTCMAELDGAIDSSPRVLPSGEVVVYWKSTGFNSIARPSQLWVSRLAPDGSTLVGAPINLLNQTAPWEARGGVGCAEAPALLQHGGNIYLFYSGGDWTAGRAGVPYSIGYATCETAFGPCVKRTAAAPWFGPTYNGTVGPGGQEFFLDAGGAPWIVFHGWKEGDAGYENGGKRRVRFKPLGTGVMPSLMGWDG